MICYSECRLACVLTGRIPVGSEFGDITLLEIDILKLAVEHSDLILKEIHDELDTP